MDPDPLLGPQGIEARFDSFQSSSQHVNRHGLLFEGSEWSDHKTNDTLSANCGKLDCLLRVPC